MVIAPLDGVGIAGQATLPAPLGTFLSLLLTILMGVLGVGVGEWVLHWLGVKPAGWCERLALAGGLGLGGLGYVFLALGLVGLLRPWVIWATLGLAGVGTALRLRGWVSDWRRRWDGWPSLGLFERLGVTLILVMAIIVLVRCLAPVTDYDALTYHLVVPRDYLQAGRIMPRPGESHANFPLTVDLLFIPPILLGLESAARLIHLTFGLLVAVGVYGLTRRLLDTRRGAWMALLLLGTTPVIGTVGGYAHTDLGWVLFEFLSAYAVLCWSQEGEKQWLILGGLFAGFGLGSKYLGLPALGVLGLAVLFHSSWVARRSWHNVLGDGALFGAVAVIVASPWYLKNWIWLGNPVYPLWFGGRGWDAYQWASLLHTGTRYGPRQGWLGLLLLPWDLYRHTVGYFGPTPFVFPTPLALLLPLYVLVRRRPVVNLALLIAAVRFVTWALSARNARYLMDVFPLFAIVVAYLLVELARWRWMDRLAHVLVFVLLVANLAWQALLLIKEDPLPVILGLESREAYLSDHNEPPYRAIQFINQLPPGSRVLFVGSGQSYYVTVDHLADVNHDNWGHLMYRWGEGSERLHQALVDQGFTHIYYSGYDFTWQLNFDSSGQMARELSLFHQFVDACARPVYDAGPNGQVYALLDQCE